MARSRRARRRSGRSRRARGVGVWLGRAVIVLVVLGLLGVLGAYFWFQNFLRSERFRDLVNNKVSEKLEVEAAFDKFLWDGMELRSPNFAASGENMIRRIDLEGLETEVKFGPLLSKRVETQEIHARSLHVEIDVTREGPQPEEEAGEAFKFSTARLDELTGAVDFGTSALLWEGIKGSITPGHTRGSYEATLSRGLLRTPLALFPRLELEEARLRYLDKELYLTNGDWKVFKSGRLGTDGEMNFRNGSYSFNGNLTNVECEEVLPDDWAKRLRGQLRSSFVVEGAGKEPPLVTGDLDLARGTLTALPVLDKIAAYTKAPRFRRLMLGKARLDFRQQGDHLELTEIVIATDGLRIEGDLQIDGEQLDGEIQLGLTPETLASIPSAAHRVFTPGKNGMHWTPVKISGTTTIPREDLSDRLVAAGFQWMYEMVDGQLVLKNTGKVAGELATTLWDTGGEAARIGAGILEQGTELLKEGIADPLGPVRKGVGSVVDGILGNPSRRVEKEPSAIPAPTPGKAREVLPEEEKEESPEDEKDGERTSAKKPKEEVNKTGEEQAGESLSEKARKAVEKELGLDESP